MTNDAVKLLVALAIWVGALGAVLAFAQDEDAPRSGVHLEHREVDERTERREAVATAQSCVVESRNGSEVRFCTSTPRVRPLQAMTFEVTNDLAQTCGLAALDFGDGSRSAPLARVRPTPVEHAYGRPGSYLVRVVSTGCPPSDGLRVLVTP